MKSLLVLLIVTLFFVSTNAISADYSQTQNKVDDKMNAPKDPHSHEKKSSEKSDSNKSSDKSSSGQTSSSNSGSSNMQGSGSAGNNQSK